MKEMIQISNVSKMYRLGQIGATTLSDDLKRIWFKVRGKENPFLKIGEENNRLEKKKNKSNENKKGACKKSC